MCTLLPEHLVVFLELSSVYVVRYVAWWNMYYFVFWLLGGHTAEMMNIVTTLQKDRFAPRYYVAALTDNMSLQKAQVYEQSLIQVEVNYYVALNQLYAGNLLKYLEYGIWLYLVPFQSDGMKTAKNAHFMQIYRSREVGQSYITSIATTLLATLHAMWLVIRIRPQVVCT